MNVIVSNKNQALLAGLDIDVLESINGVFTVEELVAKFSNFFYKKMIIDITAIKDYENVEVMQKLSVNFDMNKVIILLDDSKTINSPMYLSQLVSMGIYNFASTLDAVKFLIDNPNSYKDVAQFHNLNGFQNQKMNDASIDYTKGTIKKRVIGFKNVTEHAGSTTLVYLLKLHLEKYYKVKAVEVDGVDFAYLNDRSLDRTTGIELPSYLANNASSEVILLDLNGNYEDLCDEVIYLIEPGLIKLNKLIRQNKNIFTELKNKKIVLNRSVLSSKDVQDFERESGSKVFYNMPYLDDKIDNQDSINEFLASLGFSRVSEDDSKGIFSIFK